MIMPPPPAPLLLDTNVWIYHMRLALSDEVALRLGDAIRAKNTFISVITRIEMLAWKGHTDESFYQTTELMKLLPELPMD